MMFCRAAWQRLAPLARKTLTPLSNAVFPTRPMSFGLPASGTNMAYVVLGGSSLTAALVYAYKTINSDSARYNERIAQLEARPKRALAEVASVAEAETTAGEMINAEAEQTPEPVEAATAIVEAVAADAEEPTASVAEDVTAEAAAAPIAETTVIPMSDLLSTVKILAGSTGEIAAASVGDQHLVAPVRLAEENNSMEALNGLEVADVKAEVAVEVPEGAVVEETMIGRLNLKTEGKELEGLPSSLDAVEEIIVVADDRVESEEESPAVPEDNAESLASSQKALVTEKESILEFEDSTSHVVKLSEDETVSGAAELTSETVEEVGQEMEECKALCHEPTATETAHADLTAPPADLEDPLQATGETDAAEEGLVMEMVQDAVEKAKPVEASDEAVGSGNVALTMTQA
ncbi:translation initiation factor IF-2 isoform X2 [Carassius auratus]|uniref:Translation initiation factor IF-2 isoform X2 n=1 Tax=Carassius auratus TaxID=7957 RepID=A0A6P6JJT3_CARAU|nr:translation initiation factor IF-2-like isoform X2 [Carassius auratus]